MLETCKGMCPWCGEPVELVIDPSVTEQEYVEDCQVCCQPMLVSVVVSEDSGITLSLDREND
ncbi:MAG: CPXCG motif-containing cysteine-rich protein [Pseudomonadales bacterium]|nr:CPXCG motif-containing cysteine-rich protein [Pseudomonadales bacterium]